MVALILFAVLYFLPPSPDCTKTDIAKRTYTCAPYWFVRIKKTVHIQYPVICIVPVICKPDVWMRPDDMATSKHYHFFFFCKRTAIKKNSKRFVHFSKTTLNLNKSIHDQCALSKHLETMRGG